MSGAALFPGKQPTAVQGLLKCSIQWARVLTREARAQSKAERDEKIIELASAGKSQEAIADVIGCAQQTVSDRLSYRKRKASESGKSTATTNTATNRKPASERAAEIQSLADKGHRASQIATKLGIGEPHVRELAKSHDITLPDAYIGRTYKIDASERAAEILTMAWVPSRGLQ